VLTRTSIKMKWPELLTLVLHDFGTWVCASYTCWLLSNCGKIYLQHHHSLLLDRCFHPSPNISSSIIPIYTLFYYYYYYFLLLYFQRLHTFVILFQVQWDRPTNIDGYELFIQTIMNHIVYCLQSALLSQYYCKKLNEVIICQEHVVLCIHMYSYHISSTIWPDFRTHNSSADRH
jgi:hypothetical protein